MGLGMELSQHDVRLPAADELDDVVIDLCAQECHVTIGMQGAGRHIVFTVANVRSDEADGLMQQ
jgi:hypothetical protein